MGATLIRTEIEKFDQQKNHTNASAAHANTHPKHCHPCG